ncbi:hypothetical protein RND81_06G136800 [Saponaria officinalis]|uniref:Uncharacterized protein n=1 Tax=Saponaria officinalis TaxID=3572 RepID=A0AAW1KBB8_SAPOF
MAAPDLLFNLRNSFYLGSYQSAINTSDIPNLSPEDAVERDPIVFRSHIAHGSHQLVINEIDSSAATPLQVVKLLDIYLSSPDLKVVLCVLPSSSFFSALFFIYFFCSFAFLCFFMICNLLRGPRRRQNSTNEEGRTVATEVAPFDALLSKRNDMFLLFWMAQRLARAPFFSFIFMCPMERTIMKIREVSTTNQELYNLERLGEGTTVATIFFLPYFYLVCYCGWLCACALAKLASEYQVWSLTMEDSYTLHRLRD